VGSVFPSNFLVLSTKKASPKKSESEEKMKMIKTSRAEFHR
jgi:hypothetical protein